MNSYHGVYAPPKGREKVTEFMSSGIKEILGSEMVVDVDHRALARRIVADLKERRSNINRIVCEVDFRQYGLYNRRIPKRNTGRRSRMAVVIREDMEQYMRELREWLEQEKDTPLEEMAGFFQRRIGSYEERMQTWREAYARIPGWIDRDTKRMLDLGCGTGLELESIFSKYPHIQVTGIDLCSTMLERLRHKYREKDITLVCGDYFQESFGESCYDMVISFESLHHFLPGKKRLLFEKIRAPLKPGGRFLEADYIACCEEEENLLRRECERKRKAGGISEEQFVHFDIPLTLEHETELLLQAGFSKVNVPDSIEGATFIEAVR